MRQKGENKLKGKVLQRKQMKQSKYSQALRNDVGWTTHTTAVP